MKHSDVRLQFFKWLGKYFAELCLIFGSISSVGLYDRLARVVLHIALHDCSILRRQVARHLDDVVAAGTKKETVEFYQKYKETAESLGVELAEETDPDKAFAPCQEGRVFGLEYDTQSFTWWFWEDKLARIVDTLNRVIEQPDHTLRFMKSLAGKIMDVRLMVPYGKFNVGQIIKCATGTEEDLEAMVTATEWCRAEAFFWKALLPFCGKRMPLPDPDESMPPWSVQVYTDSAGGSMTTLGVGMGAVIFPHWWTYAKWGTSINCGKRYRDGKKISNKMSALELISPLAVLCAAGKELMGKPVEFLVDNSGSVAIFKKGWCTSCMLCTTLVVAISQVAAALHCKVDLKKVKRCSTIEACAADSLSKGDFKKFRKEMPSADLSPAALPKELLLWIDEPKEDRLLGQKILKEMSQELQLVGYSS